MLCASNQCHMQDVVLFCEGSCIGLKRSSSVSMFLLVASQAWGRGTDPADRADMLCGAASAVQVPVS